MTVRYDVVKKSHPIFLQLLHQCYQNVVNDMYNLQTQFVNISHLGTILRALQKTSPE